jgi:hypothetical protein
MARTPIVAIHVDSSDLFHLGGDVYDWTEKICRQVQREARVLCPPGRSRRRATTRYVSKGVLRATIRSRTRQAGSRLDVGVISVGPADQGGGDYTEFVLGGTAFQGTRYIYSHRGFANKAIIDAVISRRGVRVLGVGRVGPKDLQGNWVMRFRTDGGRHFRVHGQKRNPFMYSAWNRVARRHGMGEFPVPWQ